MPKTQHYLFDWGDTIMVDLPHQVGPMCDWPEVKLVDGAKDCLKRLSWHTPCHLATNAQDSNEAQIRQALIRAGINQFITSVFCHDNLGVDKTTSTYYSKIMDELGVPASQVTMIGDSLDRDVIPAIAAGLNAIWFTQQKDKLNDKDIYIISHFGELH